VNVDFIIKTDGTAFTSVFNPRANGGANTQSQAAKAVAQGSDGLPF
jgi:hypothetical protein